MSFENKGSIAAKVLVTSEPGRRGNVICNGTSDETDINRAFTYLTSGRSQKETVKLIGDFTVDDPIQIPSLTILDLTEAYITLANSTDTNIIENANPGPGDTDINVVGGILNGNKANQASGRGIVFNNVDRGTVRECYVFDCFQSGIWFTGCTHCDAHGNVLVSNGQHGIKVSDTSSWVNVVDNLSESHPFHGISVESSSFAITVTGNTVNYNAIGIVVELVNVRYCTVTGNSVFQNSGGIVLIDTDYCTISGNNISQNDTHGIEFRETSNHNNVVGNVCVGNARLNDNTKDDIFINDDSNYNHIEGNLCRAGLNAAKPRYGININTANCVGNRVFDNDLYDDGFGTAPFNDAGTDTKLAVAQFQFTEAVNGAIVTASPTGVDVDATTEAALAWGQLPFELQQAVRLKIWAVATDAPIGAGGQMHLEVTFNAGASNAAYNEAAKSWNLINFDGEEADYVVNDVVHWVIEDADVGTELLNLVGSDSFEMFAIWETGADPDGATDALFRVVEVEYV